MAGSAFQLADLVADSLAAAGLRVWGCILAVAFEGRTIRIADAHRGDGKRFIVRADDKPSAFVELERQALTVTFYLASIHADPARCPMTVIGIKAHRWGNF